MIRLPPRLTREIIFALFSLLCSWLFTIIYLKTTHQYEGATIEMVGNFAARRPFQYRFLLPWIGVQLQNVVGWPLQDFSFWVILFSTWGLAWTFRRILEIFFSDTSAWLYSFSLFYVLFWNYCTHNDLLYLSDLPSVAIFALGLWALLRKKWGVFYAVLAIGLWNRETLLFLSMAFVLLFARQPRRWLWGHLSVQILLFLMVKMALSWRFASSPGALAEWHLLENFNLLSILAANSSYTEETSMVFLFGGVWLLAFYNWPAFPAPLRRIALIIPAFLAVMLVVGNVTELRIYGELVPLVLILGLCGLDLLLRDGRGLRNFPMLESPDVGISR